jgi:hypothetical protein
LFHLAFLLGIAVHRLLVMVTIDSRATSLSR